MFGYTLIKKAKLDKAKCHLKWRQQEIKSISERNYFLMEKIKVMEDKLLSVHGINPNDDFIEEELEELHHEVNKIVRERIHNKEINLSKSNKILRDIYPQIEIIFNKIKDRII